MTEKDVEDLKIDNIGEKERKILLMALDFNLNKLKCQQCGEKVNHKDCCIMSAVKTKLLATILCDSPLCMAEYLTELSNKKEKGGDDCNMKPNYKKGYEILSEYFDSISDEEKPKVDKQLKKIGL